MSTVALIGSDGAGKSRIAAELTRSFSRPVKVVYLGMNPESGRFALPTTRVSHFIKRRRAGLPPSGPASGSTSLHSIDQRKDTRGRVWATLRLVNRISEASVKMCVAWGYQLTGALVVFDRHYLFDFTPSSSDRPRRLTSRLFLFFLERLYPKPGLVIFLDAPTDVLLARKQEVPADYLDGRRTAFLRRGSGMRNFVIVDAGRDFDAVYRDVASQIRQHLDNIGEK